MVLLVDETLGQLYQFCHVLALKINNLKYFVPNEHGDVK